MVRHEIFSRIAAVFAIAAAAFGSMAHAAPTGYVTLHGHVRPIPAGARYAGIVDASAQVSLSVALPLRNEQALQELIGRIYDPKDSLYGQYLTPDAFTEGYGAVPADYQVLKSYLETQGLTVTREFPNRMLINVQGPAGSVERAFNVTLKQYTSATGRSFHSIDTDPSVPASIAPTIKAIVGLDTSRQLKPYIHTGALKPQFVKASYEGTGFGNTFGPNDVHTTYSLSSSNLSSAGLPTTLNGAGQTIGLFEFGGGFAASDIATYTSFYSAFFGTNFTAPLVNVALNGWTGVQDSSAYSETTLDIDCILDIAPEISRIVVFEDTDQGNILECLNEAATDTTDTGTGSVVNVISISYGAAESLMIQYAPTDAAAENQALEQLSALGVTVLAASGDDGAFDNWPSDYNRQTQDPASQPYVTSVGGTSLTETGSHGYGGEVVWNDSTFNDQENDGTYGTPYWGISGGGISQIWTIPAYQSEYIATTNSSGYSTTNRNVPDVALQADEEGEIPYGIYYDDPTQGPGWYGAGGTSAATPVWAGFVALLDQERATLGQGAVGFMNPTLYKLSSTSAYSSDFHDVVSGNNGTPSVTGYSAATGYDLTTGLGSFIGASLLHDLSIGAPASTSTAVSSSLNPSTAGTSVTFTATVSPAVPNGETVTFYDGATLLGSGTTSSSAAVYSTSSLSAGNHSITARYSGDTAYSSSTSPVLTQVVNSVVATSITLVSSLNPSTTGALATFTATIDQSVPNGESIAFYDGTAQIGSSLISGSTASYSTSSLSAGSHSITAVYAGDSTFAASTSNAVVQLVNSPGSSTSTSLASSQNPAIIGGQVVLTATISPAVPDGEPVTFYNGTTALGISHTAGSISTFGTTFTSAGAYSISAWYTGDGTYGSSTSNVVTQVVTGTVPTFQAGLNFFSSPYDYSGVALDTLFGYSGVKLAVYSPANFDYWITPDGPANSVQLGVGYWVRLPQAVTFSSVGTPASTATSFPIQLLPGWNQIGDPFTVSIPLSRLTFGDSNTPFSQASSGSNAAVDSTFWAYSASAGNGNGGYTAASSLSPMQAYWIYAYAATTMHVPPQ